MSEAFWDCIRGSVPYVAATVALFGTLHLWVWYESRRPLDAAEEKHPASEEGPPTITGNVPLSWIREHLPLAATLAAFGVVLLRTLLVTADTSAALALLRATGPVAVLLGILAGASGAIATIAAIQIHTWYRRSVGREAHPSKMVRWYVFLATLFVTGTLVSCTQFIVLIVALLALTFWPRGKPLSPQKAEMVIRGSRVLIVWFFALFYLLGDDVWLPAETVLAEGDKTYVGYVLESDSEWTTLLLEDERRVEVLSTSEILSRRLCQPEDEEREPSFVLVVGIEGRETTPTCDPDR